MSKEFLNYLIVIALLTVTMVACGGGGGGGSGTTDTSTDTSSTSGLAAQQCRNNIATSYAELDSGIDGSVDGIFRNTYTYNSDGYKISSDSSAYGADGTTLTWSTSTTNSYDSNNNLTSSVSYSDNSGDGATDWITTYSRSGFDSYGNAATSTLSYDSDADGTEDSTDSITATYAYDSNGNLTQASLSYSSGRADVTDYTYNSNNLMTAMVSSSYNDGTLEITYNDSFAYDSDGYRTSMTRTSSNGSIESSSYIYNSEGYVSKKTSYVDSDGDGNNDYSDQRTRTYTYGTTIEQEGCGEPEVWKVVESGR